VFHQLKPIQFTIQSRDLIAHFLLRVAPLVEILTGSFLFNASSGIRLIVSGAVNFLTALTAFQQDDGEQNNSRQQSHVQNG